MIDLNKVKTYSIKKRKSKVAIKNFAKIPKSGTSFKDFLNSLPNILAVQDFKNLVKAIVYAHKKGNPIIFSLGGHIIKCGLGPIIIELMRKKIITALAFNGATSIHDFEVALIGTTSEDVESAIKDGSFGMAKETAKFMNEAIDQTDKGLGWLLGKKIITENFAYKKYSILSNAFELNIPVNIFVAIGTDIIHQHPSFEPQKIAKASFTDFKIFTSIISKLEGGVFINFGSAVILPEVFLKALNITRNLGYKIQNFTTANFDMFVHYRPEKNILARPGGKSYRIIGHHEIMVPLLAHAILEEISDKK